MRAAQGMTTEREVEPEDINTYNEMGNFTMIPRGFIEDCERFKVQTRWLYVILLSHRSNKTGDAFPSYKRIETYGLTRASIAVGLKELEKAGWIEKKKRFGSSTIYKFYFPTKVEF